MRNESRTWDVAIGIDWADSKNDYCTEDGKTGEFENTPEGIYAFVQMIRDKHPGQTVAICLEQTHGALAYALLEWEELILYPINPGQLAHFRKALQPGGKIDDPSDAKLLLEILQKHHSALRVWKPADPRVRALRALVQQRRMFVDERTTLSLKVQAALKKYYPLALELTSSYTSELFLDLLTRWPNLDQLKRQRPTYLTKFFRSHHCQGKAMSARLDAIRDARFLVTDQAIIQPQSLLVSHLVKQIRQLNKTITEYDRQIAERAGELEDTALFRKIRGVGEQLAPRLVSAFGTDRNQFENAGEIQAYGGVAPVTKRSGKKINVIRRYACPNFLRQTFHEFAEQMRKFSTWSAAYYRMMRERGKGHHTAIRALAFKWIRILFVVWKEAKPYDEEKYIRQLVERNSPICQFMTPENQPCR